MKNFANIFGTCKRLVIRRKRIRIALLIIILVLLIGGIVFWMCLPNPLFDDPVSTVLLDRDGKLLSASIAADEQWRFPPVNEVPEKFARAITCTEDKYFFWHPGVDPTAIIRALWLNIQEKRVVSGASTITMQVIRLARKGQPRTLKEKLIEMALALRLECSLNKQEILALYASYAPFGGNVVGIEAAAWRYFGREPQKLSWAETAMLAVLPNNPALVHPGKNRQILQQKRDRLLDKLHEQGTIDALTCTLAKAESLPPEPHPIPMLAPHLLARVQADVRDRELSAGRDAGAPRERSRVGTTHSRVRTTVDKYFQTRAIEIILRHHEKLVGNGVYNAAALIVEVDSGNVLAYVGNVHKFADPDHGNYVDIVTAPRSTGSILKPLLYAGMLEDGALLPLQLIPDIPTRLGAFAPKNYSRTYQGAVPAYMALAQSLNIPAVRLLGSYGVDRFSTLLKQLGMTTLHRPAAEYGLSLILGGAEGSLWELTGIYASMARILTQYTTLEPDGSVISLPNYVYADTRPKVLGPSHEVAKNPLGASASWLMLEAMLEVVRPGEESGWRNFSSSQKIAWKTGTSYGYRDAWAIGVTPQYAVGVWVGNADGEGRPGLTGLSAAAPILFELFGVLDGYGWFAAPEMDLVQIAVCAKSGYRAGPHCAHTRTIQAPRSGLRSKPCPYCVVVHCDSERKWRIHSECERIAAITPVKWFVLPPAMEWYYKQTHSDYHPLPPYRPDCLALLSGSSASSMTLLYPEPGSRIYVPLELDGTRGRTVFEAAHRKAQTTIYWHLDDQYLGETQDIHQFALIPSPGRHTVTLVDEDGEFLQQNFIVLQKQ